jgi:hypothetical protein
LAITVLFLVFIVLKRFIEKLLGMEFCGICAAVFCTWFTLLMLYWNGVFDDKVILAMLIGESTLGIFYLAEKKASEGFKLFRLPFLLTLIFIGYSVINASGDVFDVVIMLMVLWTIFVLLYIYKNNPKVGFFANKVIKCCMDW